MRTESQAHTKQPLNSLKSSNDEYPKNQSHCKRCKLPHETLTSAHPTNHCRTTRLWRIVIDNWTLKTYGTAIKKVSSFRNFWFARHDPIVLGSIIRMKDRWKPLDRLTSTTGRRFTIKPISGNELLTCDKNVVKRCEKKQTFGTPDEFEQTWFFYLYFSFKLHFSIQPDVWHK